MGIVALFAPIWTAVLSLVSDESNAAFAVGCALFLAGPLFFSITHVRYRNRSERHYHERETPVRVENLKTSDHLEEQLTRQTSPKIANSNSTQIHGSLVKGGILKSMASLLGSLMGRGADHSTDKKR
ncbi:MAG: hypothetical protein LBU07_05745 [Coriobacteriales bacterium]|jgi:hypothetical protein|nr:hypothetical protein [Coriobacteriales bacterium]